MYNLYNNLRLKIIKYLGDPYYYNGGRNKESISSLSICNLKNILEIFRDCFVIFNPIYYNLF
jgi:hypothetical protein